MKTILTLILSMSAHFVVLAQANHSIIDPDGNPVNYGVSAFKSKIPLYINVDANTKTISPFNYLPADPLGTAVFLTGATTAKVTTRLRSDSLSYYRYSVIENDTVVKVWEAKLTKVDFVWNKYSDWPGYLTVDLPIPAIKGKKITVKIYRLPQVSEITTLVIYNKPLPSPKLMEAYLRSRSSSSRNMPLKVKDGDRIKVTDTTDGLFIKKEKTDVDFAQHVFLKFTNGDRSETVDLSNNWRYSSDDGNPIFLIEKSNFKAPGNYEIIFRTVINKFQGFEPQNGTSVFRFTVASPPVSFSVSQVLGIVGVLIVLSIVFILIKNKQNKAKEMRLSLHTEAARSELQRVRAQLNPHFVFNALSGIQNLMNNKAVEDANHYLGKFANLTRQVLDDRELITLADEVQFLQDYLSMEQLRFPFSFAIHVDEEDGFKYTEIPAMLLQPFVENAVKHGVALLKGEGSIEIEFTKSAKDIILSVKDNGRGFDQSTMKGGLGLKLSKKRIALLNDTYQDCPILLEIDVEQGTKVRIILTNWLT